MPFIFLNRGCNRYISTTASFGANKANENIFIVSRQPFLKIKCVEGFPHYSWLENSTTYAQRIPPAWLMQDHDYSRLPPTAIRMNHEWLPRHGL
jgi:hypothetical protein